MKIVEFPEDGMLTKINEVVLSLQPQNSKGQRILKEIVLTEEEWENLREELREYGIIPAWVQFVTVNGESPFKAPQIQQVSPSVITPP